MNKKDKLTEATMLALQGKLNERMKKHIEYNVCADVDSEDVIETFFNKDDAIEFAKNSPRAEIVQAVEVEMDDNAYELGDVIPTKIVWSKNNIIQSKKEEKKLTEDEYTENLKATIRDNDTLTFAKNWLNTIDNMVNDLTNEYNDMYQDVRDAIDNLFSGSTPTSCLVGLSNAVRDIKEELENIKFED